LLGLSGTDLLWDIITYNSVHQVTSWDHFLGLNLIADLPRDRGAVLTVAVTLCLSGPVPSLQLTDLLGLKVAILFLHRDGERVGELLAESTVHGTAHFFVDSSRRIVTILPWNLVTDRLRSISTTSTFLLATLELYSILTSHVIQYGLLVLTIFVLKVTALEVILGVESDVICGVAEPVLDCGAHLHLVILLQCEIVNFLFKPTNQLVDVEALPLHLRLNHSGAILELFDLAHFLILGVTGFFLVIFTDVLKGNFFLIMTSERGLSIVRN